MMTFLQDLADLKKVVEKSSAIQEEYVEAYQRAHESLFGLLNSGELDNQNPYSRWMKYYFDLEHQFFGGVTLQNATLGSRLETAVKHAIKSKFPDRVPHDFVELRRQYPYKIGNQSKRIEIGLPVNNPTTFIQVKRGFGDWKEIEAEKRAIEEKDGHRYLLLSPTEYTNEAIRKEIREKHQEWCFIWIENNWDGLRYWNEEDWNGQCDDHWMERFLDSIYGDASL